MRAPAAMRCLLLACLALIALANVAAQSQIVSYPTDLRLLDPSAIDELQTSPVVGTLDAGGDNTDVQFRIHAQNEDGTMQNFHQVLQCADGVTQNVFGDESTLLIKDVIDDGPPDCVVFGMNFDTQESFGARVYVTLDQPTTGLMMVIAPTGKFPTILDDIWLSEDFEIIADGCTNEDGTKVAGCYPIQRNEARRLSRRSTSKGVIRFNKAITTIIATRNTVCGAKFDFTLALQKKVDCVQAPACDWSECDSTCGSGTQTRTLFVVQPPLNGGKACLPEVETRPCAELPVCSADCEVGDWGEWSACSASCGGGTRTQTRVIEANPIGNGAVCPALSQTEACNTDACPTDCKMGDWKPWSECTNQCGGGMQTRTREVITPAANGGEECGSDEESQICNTQECPVPCEQSDWSPWSECSAQCGPGLQNSTRVTITFPENGGDACGPELQTQACNNGPCPVDCQVSEWSSFGECSVQCGGGTKKRTRTITVQPANGGLACPALEDEDDCNYNACPVPCKVGEWTAWSTCSASCGEEGVSTRTREVITPAANNGDVCPPLLETQPCNRVPCPVDCEMGDFSEWSQCSKTCGGGTQIRTRTIDVQPANGGAVCLPTQESQPCNTQACPVDCKLSDWQPWSECSLKCGGGLSTRKRTIVQAPANGGAPCDVTEETQPCNTAVCDVPCVMSPWTEYSECDKPCAGGVKTRTRTIITPSAGNGEKCGPTTDTVPCNTQACAVDCQMSEFGAWSSCSQTCGGGFRTRVRQVLVPSSNNGLQCPCTTETEQCNTQDCPVDCKVSEWSAPSSCTATCGGGTTTRTRYVTQQPLNNGASCPVLEETTDCNTQTCPTDCVMNDWTEWSTCSATCGGGVQKRTRDVLQPAKDGGAACPANVEEVRPCNTVGCPVDCVMSPWVDSNVCSAQCGGGVETWTRTVITPPQNGGLTCGDLTRSEPCNTQECPTNCVVSEWSDFGTCSATCGGGEQTRTRTIIAQPTNGGNRCPSTLSETVPCNTQGCPVDCKMGDWTPWSTCSATCGSGTQQRTRPIVTAPSNGGAACPAQSEFQTCNTQKCARDCEMSEWKDWTKCSRSCGGGLRLRYRTITKFPSCGGAKCGSLVDIEKCNTQACDVDCKMGDWSSWGQCSKQCGGGEQTRTRNVVKARCGQGAACPPETEKRPCNTQACAQDCVQGPWSEWGQCSASCGGGVQTRERSIVTAPTGCGKKCSFSKETRRCNEKACPRDCEMGEWGQWGSCSKKCGGGKMIRSRSVKKQKCGKGSKQCPPIYEQKDCNTQACTLPKIDCVVSKWGAWGGCSKNCGGGIKSRSRTVLIPALNGGKVCPVLTETALCNQQECPVDCKVSPFTPWSACTKQCGGGKQVRTRSVLNPQCGSGQVCPPLKEEQACNTQACDQDCKVSEWSSWGTCSKQCGSGTQTRTRKITQAASGKGRTCPPLSESQTCNTQACPSDCKVSDFGSWSTCSKTCGGGTQTRKRTIISAPCGSGASCPALTETQACNTQTCEKDCKVSDWGCWGSCSKSCGGGVQTRSRSVLVQPSTGGKQCPALTDQQVCNTQACQQDCVVSAWSAFNTCSKSCGGGVQTRTRTVLIPATNGGKSCPVLSETTSCNTQSCAVDCQVSDFGAWSTCSQTCGGGVQTRTRKVTVPAQNGGKSCPCLSETQKCNTQSCSKDCQVSDWTAWSTCSKTCGGGWTYQYRKVTQLPSCGGDKCPALVNYKACNTQPCVTDCKTSDWSNWGTCSKTCGGGTQTRKRTITQYPCKSGASCPSDLVQTQPCNTQPCASDCKVSDFGAWSTCSKTCGGGVTTRTRSVISQPTGCGATCPPLTESSSCNTQPCSQNCQVSAWSSFGTCSKACGGGVATRTRTVVVPPSGGGSACPVLTDTTACNTQACTPGGTCAYGDVSYVVKSTGVEVTFANGIDSIDVNIRITHSNGQTVTLNFHPNKGCSKGSVIFFDLLSHINFPKTCTNGEFKIVWVQVNGSNCHFGENNEPPVCGTVPQQCAWVYSAFGACSNQCGSGTQSRTAVCKTASGAACDASKCGTAQLTQSCSSQAACGVGCQATSCSGDGSYSTVSFATGSQGVLAITVKYVQPTFGDIRGLFLDFSTSSRLYGKSSKCTLTGSAVTNFDRDTKSMGCDSNINLNGCAGPSKYDLAAAFGTNGLSKDDIRSTTVYLACSGYTLTLDDVKDAQVGVRAQSVGSSANNRNQSTKQVCVVGNQ